MKKMEGKAEYFDELRKKTKAIINAEEGVQSGEMVNVKELLDELGKYQIELELQNEKLRFANAELAESRDRYANLFNFAPVGYIKLSEQGLIVEANLTLASMLKVDRSILMNSPLATFIFEDDRDRFDRLCQEMFQTTKSKVMEVRMKNGEDSWFWAKVHCALTVDFSTNRRNIRVAVIDISEQKRVEEKLQENEQYFRLALDATSDGVWERNPQTGEIYYGENWAKILGYSSQEIKEENITWEDLLHPDDKERSMAEVQKYLEGRTKTYVAEFRMRCKGGAWKWIRAKGKVVEWDSNGKPLRFVGTHTDISDRKHTEGNLRNSEERFQTLIALSPAGIYLTDSQGNYLYVNQQWCKMAGLSEKDALGNGWIDGIHPDDRELVFSFWNQMLESGGSKGVEYRLITPAGKTTWIHSQAQAMPGGNDGRAKYLVVNTDITTRKQAEIELKMSFSELEKIVKERTVDLVATNRRLQEEIRKQKKTEEALLNSERNLEKEKTSLQEANIALRVLLKKGDADRRDLEERLLVNIKQLIEPYLEQLEKDDLTERQKQIISTITTNLHEVTSPFMRNISSLSLKLSPMEIKVATFVKEGKTSKEIAEKLSLSPETINVHRKKIRKKCGISNKKNNLRSILLSFDD